MTAAPAGDAPDPRALMLAARLASALLDPPDDAGEGFGRPLGALPAASGFKGPLRRARARLDRLDALPLGPGFVDRLRSSAATRLCVLLVSQPAAAVRGAALMVAAVAFHRGLIGVVLKADRDRLRGEVGDEAFEVATQEAVLLHAPLGALGDGEPAWTSAEPGVVRTRLARAGAAMLSRFVALTEPGLAEAFDRRLPEAADQRPGAVIRFDRSHCDHVVRLLRRRGPGWATLIA